jgi:hypothetical protein
MAGLWGIGSTRAVVLGSASVVVLGVLGMGGSLAHGTPSGPSVAVKVPAGRTGELTGVAAVPHSSDVLALGLNGTTDNAKFFVGRRHHGRWQKLATPNLHGRCGVINAIAAGSSKSVFLGGATQLKCPTGGFVETAPAIWRLKGSKFVAQKLPALNAANSGAVGAISASSATNAWAVGSLYPGPTAAQEAFHWNGKKWSAVTIPAGYSQGMFAVSTSGPTNAWGLQSDYQLNQFSLVQWNGKVWTVVASEPTGMALTSVATSSAKLAYAVGFNNQDISHNHSFLLKFNGKTWSNVALPKVAVHSMLNGVTMHGRSAWIIGTEGAHPILLHSTGGVWKVENDPGKSYQLMAVNAASTAHAYAVGLHDVADSGSPSRTYFEMFSGHSWKGEPSKF